MIKIQFGFHGGAREVGRSCIQIEVDGFSVMLDCGVKLRLHDVPGYTKTAFKYRIPYI